MRGIFTLKSAPTLRGVVKALSPFRNRTIGWYQFEDGKWYYNGRSHEAPDSSVTRQPAETVAQSAEGGKWHIADAAFVTKQG